MRLQKKSYSRISLTDLLRRRRSTLKDFLDQTGIVTYELLLLRCESMGVVPPGEPEFKDAMGNPPMPNISSPTEGVVVVDSVENLPVSEVRIEDDQEPQAAVIETAKVIQKKRPKRNDASDPS